MSSKLKACYLNYLQNTSKFLILTTDKNTEIVIKTSNDKFPHLIGQSYFPKYRNLPSKKFLDDILNEKIENKHIMSLDKDDKTVVLKKIKAFEYLSSGKIHLVIANAQTQKSTFGDAIKGDGFLLVTTNTKNCVLVILKKDGLGINHPVSILLIENGSKKYNQVLSLETIKIIKHRRSKTFKKQSEKK